MSRISSDDQLKFLLSCIKHAHNGKVDFDNVAQECGVVSRAAATKRYNRLLRTNGIHPNGGPLASRLVSKYNKRSAEAIADAADAKRRKIEGEYTDAAADDQEDVKPIIPKLEKDADVIIKQEFPKISPNSYQLDTVMPTPSSYFRTGYRNPSSLSPRLLRNPNFSGLHCTSEDFRQISTQAYRFNDTIYHPQDQALTSQESHKLPCCSSRSQSPETRLEKQLDNRSQSNSDTAAVSQPHYNSLSTDFCASEPSMPPPGKASVTHFPSVPEYKGHPVEAVPNNAPHCLRRSYANKSASVNHMDEAARRSDIIVID